MTHNTSYGVAIEVSKICILYSPTQDGPVQCLVLAHITRLTMPVTDPHRRADQLLCSEEQSQASSGVHVPESSADKQGCLDMKEFMLQFPEEGSHGIPSRGSDLLCMFQVPS